MIRRSDRLRGNHVRRCCCCCVRPFVARRTDQVRAANGSCHACARVCWEYPVIGSFQHTLSRSCGMLWPWPPFEFGTAKVGRVKFKTSVRTPFSACPPATGDVVLSRCSPPFELVPSSPLFHDSSPWIRQGFSACPSNICFRSCRSWRCVREPD